MRVMFVIVAATMLCACASPYVYQKEVSSFSSSVTAVSNAVAQGLENVDQDQVAADCQFAG